jgi:hypothetical protein
MVGVVALLVQIQYTASTTEHLICIGAKTLLVMMIGCHNDADANVMVIQACIKTVTITDYACGDSLASPH